MNKEDEVSVAASDVTVYDYPRHINIEPVVPVVEEVRNFQFRLPELSVKPFNGDPTLWPQFYDSFKNAIHENQRLNVVEKFSYLKSYLRGEAEKCVEGLSLTARNYAQGLQILEERYGNQQLIISKHMKTLLAIATLRPSSHVKELRGYMTK